MEYRNTKQRTKILEALQGTITHPTANWIYTQIVEEFPNISLGTVYRNLSILEEQGLVQKLSCGSTYDRYDANVTPHIHLACAVCGKVSDMHNDMALGSLHECIKTLGKDIDSYNLTCYHTCNECDTSH